MIATLSSVSYRRAGAFLAALLVSACSVGPDFKRPALPVPNGYVANGLPAHTASAATMDGAPQSFDGEKDIPANWWTIFGSPDLNRLVGEALKANPDLAAAEASLRQAKETVAATRGDLYPQVDVDASPTREKIALAAFGLPNAGSSLFTLYQTSVSVSYGLDIFGEARRALEASQAQEQYQKFEREAAYLTLTTNVVTAAVQEASLREQIKATEDIIAIEGKQRDILKSQFHLGGAPKTTLLEQEATLAQEQATLPGLQKQLEQTRDRLAVLAGHFPGEQLHATFTLASLHLPADLPVTLPSKLVGQRPDIRAAEALLHAANAEIGVATAAMLPQITLSGNYGYESAAFRSLFTPETEAWSLGSSLTQPLFHGGTLLHEKRAAVAAADKAREQYRSTVLSAFGNVADSLRALQYDAETLNSQFLAEQAAKNSLDLTQDQFKFGAIGYSLLLDAQRTYSQAHVQLVQAQAARISDTAALFQSLGGGWWNRGREMKAAEAGVGTQAASTTAGPLFTAPGMPPVAPIPSTSLSIKKNTP